MWNETNEEPEAVHNEIQKVTLTMRGNPSAVRMSGVQGDRDRRVMALRLTSNGKPYVPAGEVLPTLRATKPDGNVCYLTGTLSCVPGEVLVPMTAQLLAAPGNVRCDLSLVDSEGGTVTSDEFILRVRPPSASGEVIESSDEFAALTDMIALVLELKEMVEAIGPIPTDEIREIWNEVIL